MKCKVCGKETGPVFGMCAECIKREDNSLLPTGHIRAGIAKCDEINQNPRRWALLDVIPVPGKQSVVRVEWGHRTFDGRREKAIQTIRYEVCTHGEVVEIKDTHV